MTTLDHIRKHSIVVADTGAFESIKSFTPTDATTNPSLILATLKQHQYSKILDESISFAKKNYSTQAEQLEAAFDKCFVLIGSEILKIIPGRVSTEVDARLSFDVEAQIEKAIKLIKLYEEAGYDKSRILIKLSATWEGIQAARVLEKELGIHCNLTLIFSFYQAVACAEAGVRLISPFVGRIFDWHVKQNPAIKYDMNTDPGVKSVARIFKYFKKYGHDTQIMGASFRNTDQILGLVGCDLLTISPALLKNLQEMKDVPEVKLCNSSVNVEYIDSPITEKTFRWHMNEDEMATEKLSDGIRKFSADARTLEELLKNKLA